MMWRAILVVALYLNLWPLALDGKLLIPHGSDEQSEIQVLHCCLFVATRI